MPDNSSRNLLRVLFQLNPDDWHGSASERLWAEPLGAGRYRLENTPFFAFGVSFRDIVFAEDSSGQAVFAHVSIRGGHSTYRIIPMAKAEALFREHWAPLETLGCSYEKGQVVLAVDVPAGADIHAAFALLEAGQAAGVWDFEEGHCGHAL